MGRRHIASKYIVLQCWEDRHEYCATTPAEIVDIREHYPLVQTLNFLSVINQTDKFYNVTRESKNVYNLWINPSPNPAKPLSNIDCLFAIK